MQGGEDELVDDWYVLDAKCLARHVFMISSFCGVQNCEYGTTGIS